MKVNEIDTDELRQALSSKAENIASALELGDKCYSLVCDIVDFLRKEKEHEGTSSVATPSEMLDRIFGMASEIPEIRERILK
jgi:hypothetical protein